MNVKMFIVMASAAAAMSASAAESARPNVVIIYGDDVGYGVVGVYGAKMIPSLMSGMLIKTDMKLKNGRH